MSIGMTYDQYWYGDVRMVEAFREADRLRKEQMNYELWLQGLYVFDAVSCAVQNGNRTKQSDPISKYAEQPYEIFKKEPTKEEREAQEKAERLQAKLYMQQMMRAGKHWGGS